MRVGGSGFTLTLGRVPISEPSLRVQNLTPMELWQSIGIRYTHRQVADCALTCCHQHPKKRQLGVISSGPSESV